MKEAHADQQKIKKRYLTSLSVQATLILLFAIGLYTVSPRSTPKVERTIIPSEVRLPEKTPTVDTLIAWRNELSLTSSQVKQLSNLQENLKTQVEPLNLEIKEQTEKFKTELEQSGKKLGFADIARAARPATELGRKKRMIEYSYSEQAMSLLSSEQKEKAIVLFNKVPEQKDRKEKISDDS